jgi:hypothetical protein
MPTPRRAFLHLVACVAISLGAAMNGVWTLGKLQRRGVRWREIDLDLERIETLIRLLSAWFRRSKRRPHFTRREWILIFEYAERWGLSAAEIAREFLVSEATVHRRRKQLRQGTLATAPTKPVPPCRRICDDRRLLVADMALQGFQHNRTIARHLELQGETISERSVGRFRENPLGPAQPPEKPKRVRVKEAPEAVEACAAALALPDQPARPRVARRLKTLADAFTESIAADTLRRLEQDALDDADQRALLRTRRAQQLALLHARFRRVPPHKRPHYTDAERAEILSLKHRFRLSNRTTARWFLLDPSTISSWNADVDHPHARKRPLVQPLADIQAALASVAENLPPVPRRLEQKVAETLAILAKAVPPRKRRVRRNKQRNKPVAAAARPRNLVPIRADYPNHYWSADLTELELGRRFYLVAIIDLYSRDVMAWDAFAKKPDSGKVEALFQRAARRHGQPQHFVSDQGKEFQGELTAALEQSGIDHRQGAVGQHGSIAIGERLWRTLKACLDVKNVRPNLLPIVRERAAAVIDYYSTKRPHSALGNAAPNQVYRGERSRAHDAVRAPRGWRGEPAPALPVRVRYAFPHERKLPYLERVA